MDKAALKEILSDARVVIGNIDPDAGYEKGQIADLLSRISATIDQIDEPVIYINAYSVSRAYGGPEEGGWWYDIGEPLASMPVAASASTSQKEIIKEQLTALIGWESKRNRFSAAADPGEDFVIYVEDHKAEAFPKGRPHYE